MEKSNDCSFEFCTLICSDCNRWERFPENRFTNICSYEKSDTWTQTVTFLKKFIEHQYHETWKEELTHNKEWSYQTKFANWTIHSGQQISNSLTNCNKQTKYFLGCLEKFSIFFALHVNINHLSANKQLHDHTWCYYRTHTKLHNGTFVGG